MRERGVSAVSHMNGTKSKEVEFEDAGTYAGPQHIV